MIPLYPQQSDRVCRTASTAVPCREGEQARGIRQSPGCRRVTTTPVLPQNFPPHLPALPRVLAPLALDLSVQPDGHGLQAVLPLRCSPALDAVTFRPGMPPLREVADAWLCRYCDTAMLPVRQGGGVESGKE